MASKPETSLSLNRTRSVRIAQVRCLSRFFEFCLISKRTIGETNRWHVDLGPPGPIEVDTHGGRSRAIRVQNIFQPRLGRYHRLDHNRRRRPEQGFRGRFVRVRGQYAIRLPRLNFRPGFRQRATRLREGVTETGTRTFTRVRQKCGKE